MNPNALMLAVAAFGMSLAIGLILVAFAYFRAGTTLIRYVVLAAIAMGSGFAIHGLGTAVPRGLQVLLGNFLILSGGPIFCSGVLTYTTHARAGLDRIGWWLVATSLPLFAYWYLVEPNGTYRAMLFSAVVCLTDARIVYLLIQFSRRRPRALPVWLLATCFASISLWMLGRFVTLVPIGEISAESRGVDPTTWKTLFPYILALAVIAICCMWIEIAPIIPRVGRPLREVLRQGGASLLQPFQVKLLLLASAVIAQIVLSLGTMSIVYTDLYTYQKQVLENSARLANETMASYAGLMLDHIDNILSAVRDSLSDTASPPRAGRWIDDFDFGGPVVRGLRISDAAGRSVRTWGKAVATAADGLGWDEADSGPGRDPLLIGPVRQDSATERLILPIGRRLVDASGNFAGLIVATIDQDALATRSRELSLSGRARTSVLGTRDHKPRAGDTAAVAWNTPVASPLWSLTGQAQAGVFDTADPIENTQRTSVYAVVSDFPLVVVTSFSELDLLADLRARMTGVLVVSFVVLGFSLMFTLLLVVEAKRRDEQSTFMSMLGHELKTPLAVLRIALDHQRLPDRIGVRMQRAVGDIRDVVERCLQSDRIRHGRVLPSFAECRVGELLEDLLHGIEAADRVTVDCGALPLCQTDAALVGVIVLNLLDNALKYGRADGGVRILASASTTGSMPGVEVAVSNPPGVVGMPDPVQVFRRYYRAPGAHSRTGSGLGLSNALELARLLGGSLRYVASDDEVTFVLRLPVRPPTKLSRLKQALVPRFGKV